ncbi:MAG: dihydrolipoamide acetyltransferase family protein, partial [Pyrinomonadaceae bacterium]
MSTENVVMPQMGESITEGTIIKWLKKPGEHVERDEPLFEISTDKVDAEIPSPAAGVLTDIKAQEGETVAVSSVVAVIDSNGAAGATTVAPVAESTRQQKAEEKTEEPATTVRSAPPAAPGNPASVPQPVSIPQASSAAAPAKAPDKPTLRAASAEEPQRTRSSPLVRKIAQEHGVDVSRLEGSGLSGRVTKEDILHYIESGAASQVGQSSEQSPTPGVGSVVFTPNQSSLPVVVPAEGDRTEAMSVMRQKIAEHMVLSRRISAHVTTVYEIDMTQVARFREQHKNSFFERHGTKLTYMPFIFQAVTSAIEQFPIFNAQVGANQIIYKRDINLGMAVALDKGLIVPVIKRADQLSIAGLAVAANDLADRARTKQLKPDEVGGGTFTITNPGVFGGLFGTPIINQPQVAILCV